MTKPKSGDVPLAQFMNFAKSLGFDVEELGSKFKLELGGAEVTLDFEPLISGARSASEGKRQAGGAYSPGWAKTLGFKREEISGLKAADIKARQRELARKHHPDRPGGSTAKMTKINDAARAALEQVKL